MTPPPSPTPPPPPIPPPSIIIKNHIWDTYNEYIEEKYSPVEPGSYTWPLDGETDTHMANFFVGMDPTSPGCDGFDALVSGESYASSSATSEGDSASASVAGEEEDSAGGGGRRRRGGDGSVSYVEVGCYADESSDRMFHSRREEAADGSDMDVEVIKEREFDFFSSCSVV